MWVLPSPEPVLDPYNNPLVMPLAEWIEHPIAHELMHNAVTLQVRCWPGGARGLRGAGQTVRCRCRGKRLAPTREPPRWRRRQRCLLPDAMPPPSTQVLGLTNYSRWPEAPDLRACVRSNGVAREMLLQLAVRRLRSMAHVGLTERLQESVLSMAADLGECARPCWCILLGHALLHLSRGRAPACVSRHTRRPPARSAGLSLDGPAFQYTSANAFSYDEGAEDDEGAEASPAAPWSWAGRPLLAGASACLPPARCRSALAPPTNHTAPSPPQTRRAAPITYNATTAGGVNTTVTRAQAFRRANEILDELRATRTELDVSPLAGGPLAVPAPRQLRAGCLTSGVPRRRLHADHLACPAAPLCCSR